MPIIIRLEGVLKSKSMTAKELAKAVGITEANISILNSGKAKAIRFSTLNAICEILDCQPGDILTHHSE